MVFDPEQAYICKYESNTEGRNSFCIEQCKTLAKGEDYNKPHYFIILTSKDYNSGSKFILGVPITSKKNNPFANTFGFPIEGDVIENAREDFHGSIIMLDRPCRVSKMTIFKKGSDHYGRLIRPFYLKIIDKMTEFMKSSQPSPYD